MPRYIDAEFEEKHYRSIIDNPTPDVTENNRMEAYAVLKALRLAHSVDAVVVVRCKDCINSDWYTTIDVKRFCYCMKHGNGGYMETDFCSYGERETDGEK